MSSDQYSAYLYNHQLSQARQHFPDHPFVALPEKSKSIAKNDAVSLENLPLGMGSEYRYDYDPQQCLRDWLAESEYPEWTGSQEEWDLVVADFKEWLELGELARKQIKVDSDFDA